MKNFQVIEEKAPYEVEGCQFYEYFATYTFEHVELSEPVAVNLNVVIVEHNNYFYYINLHDCPAQNQTAVAEFDQFKRSLRMI
ncbi:MAG: hypothetical protein P8P74_16595 [Crocinitomicaceae bacterium]|nr:hypothetical protein [Crocinitomicaceae bacterium]